jgi:hypothetical protein
MRHIVQEGYADEKGHAIRRDLLTVTADGQSS